MAIDPVTAALVASTAIKVGTKIVGANSLRDSADEAREAARFNATALLSLAGKNTAVSAGAAAYNSDVVLQIGAANSSRVKANAVRNGELMTIELEEELRRHIRGEKQLAGTIRAQYSGTGFNVNTGTPLRYLHDELDEAERSRNYLAKKGRISVANYLMQEFDRASLIELESVLNAEAILFNQEAESSIYLNEAIAQASATRRGGELNANNLNSQADQLIISGVSDIANGVASSNIGGGGGTHGTTVSAGQPV